MFAAALTFTACAHDVSTTDADREAMRANDPGESLAARSHDQPEAMAATPPLVIPTAVCLDACVRSIDDHCTDWPGGYFECIHACDADVADCHPDERAAMRHDCNPLWSPETCAEAVDCMRSFSCQETF